MRCSNLPGHFVTVGMGDAFGVPAAPAGTEQRRAMVTLELIAAKNNFGKDGPIEPTMVNRVS